MSRYRVVVIGGYGFFGSRLVERLASDPGLHICVAGRSKSAADAMAVSLQSAARAALESRVLDADAADFSQALAELRPDVVVHTSGPFQGKDYRVAQACIRARAHYVDLADARTFVSGIGVLDDAARAAGVLVTSGASSVPALSSAAADTLAHGLASVESIDIGITPGNRTERGLATVQGILSYCGKPLQSGEPDALFGWSGTYRHHYPAPVGRRLLSPCDVPDLDLLRSRYPGNPSVRFGAGLELDFLHRGMNLMAFLTRAGLVRNWADHAQALKRVADWFKRCGSDAGAMHVSVVGTDAPGTRTERTWELVATHGDGPYVPTLAAASIVRMLARRISIPTGARPCLGLVTLEDFMAEAEGLRITMGITQ